MCTQDYDACIRTSIYTLIQIIIHYSFCGWCLELYNCQYVFTKKKHFTYFLYITYLYTEKCKTPTFDEVVSSEINQHQEYLSYHDVQNITWPKYAYAASRTYSICSNYTTFNTIWLITTVNLIIGACCKSKGAWAVVLYFPWVIVSFIILIYDIVVTAWYASDISHTYGLRKWFDFIGGQDITVIKLMDRIYPPINTAMPSIFMVIIFGRLFILWFINLCLFFRMLQAAVNAYRETDETETFYCIEA